jgi:hypothetical protein
VASRGRVRIETSSERHPVLSFNGAPAREPETTGLFGRIRFLSSCVDYFCIWQRHFTSTDKIRIGHSSALMTSPPGLSQRASQPAATGVAQMSRKPAMQECSAQVLYPNQARSTPPVCRPSAWRVPACRANRSVRAVRLYGDNCESRHCQHTDVRMIQAGDGLRFALKPLLPRRVRRHFLRQDLNRHVTSESSILGAVHLSHPASA